MDILNKDVITLFCAYLPIIDLIHFSRTSKKHIAICRDLIIKNKDSEVEIDIIKRIRSDSFIYLTNPEKELVLELSNEDNSYLLTQIKTKGEKFFRYGHITTRNIFRNVYQLLEALKIVKEKDLKIILSNDEAYNIILNLYH